MRWGLQHLEHLFRRAPERRLVAGHDDRPLDDDRVLSHRRDEPILRQLRRVDARLGRFFFRTSALAGIFNWPNSVFNCAAVYGVFRYSTISGSTPLSRNKASVLREVLQRGL